MSDYPKELVRRHQLFNGAEVTIRPVRPADAPMEQEFVRHLSDDSRYFRFMQTLHELSRPKLKYLTDVDYVQRLELVATVADDGGEHEIGAAMYATEADGEHCEFAIAVDDAWQGTGVAGILMIDLIDAARQRGLREMIGVVLAENHRMVKFVRQLGFTLQRDPSDPHIFVATKPLAVQR